ncbi:MAG: leucyl aminopeptidase [Chloroflexi bacterium]|nr:leucyl aminopeptidase [Chloroflexota bacterium]MQC16985.1 leucyl aminopeptidase [Chloroflexota bacterium]MQC48030.1 leucyl aminopeptidase [Chloroflexota bacterium]
MEITVASGSITEVVADTYAVPLAQGVRRLAGDIAAVDQALGGTISQMLEAGMIAGKTGEATVLPALGRRLRAKRVVVYGVGERAKLSTISLRDRMGNLARSLRGMNAGTVAVSLQEAPSGVDADAVGQAAAEGVVLGLYRFDKHHTRTADKPAHTLGNVTFTESSVRRASQTRRGVEAGVIIAEATNAMRDMANEPANLMTPTIVASRAQQMASDLGIECRIIERAEAERLKMGSYLSVANGSIQPPKFIVLTYNGARTRGRYIGLVGKGITFDTGGISIKPAAGMEAMKGDMSGAATVIAAIGAIARLKLPMNVMAVAPCTENMPSGSATKPGDVVYAMDGTSIEVINTDAEGRLVLADGIAFARENGCTSIVDVATLTGAMAVALGRVRMGSFTNNDRLATEVERAADAVGEPAWRFPMDDDYYEQIKSPVADIQNTGGRDAGSITAAKFLEVFAKDTPWVHLDIASVMSATADKGWQVKGMRGAPVRTLVEFVRGRAR